MRRLGSALVAVFVAALVAALVAGCGGSNPKPSPVSEAPSASASLSESASPSGAPTMPAEAEGTTAASAEAFVRYYLATFSYAARSNRTPQMAALTADGCSSCRRLYAQVAKTYAAGGYVKGEGYTVSTLTVDTTDLGQITLKGSVTQHDQELKPSATEAPKHYAESQLPSAFTLVAVSGGWRMLNWERT